MLQLRTNEFYIPLSNGNIRLHKGKSLNGGSLMEYKSNALNIFIHELRLPQCSLTLLDIQVNKFASFIISQTDSRLRFEALLAGQDPSIQMGQYRIRNEMETTIQINAGDSILQLIIHLSQELLQQSPLPDAFQPTSNRILSIPMLDAIDKIMSNPYEPNIRDAYYDSCVRDLLFHHISIPPIKAPGELTNTELEAVLKADRIIAEDLTVHHTIEELARLTYTNSHVLKVGFAKIFGMGTFERLRKRKMDQAKLLIETTDQQIQEIAVTAGYSSLTGFIHAFTKEFGMSPRKWRKERRS
jgi:AraC-like DNA-binding protein